MADFWTASFVDLRQRLDELFDELIYRRWAVPGPEPWRPAIDFDETPDAYLVAIDLPDVPPDRVAIRMTENEVVVSGDRPGTGLEATLHSRRERRCGPFRCVLTLARPIDPDGAEAVWLHGTCRLRLPKKPQPEPSSGRAISVAPPSPRPATSPRER